MSDLIDKDEVMNTLYDVCKEHKHKEPVHTVLADTEARISHLETYIKDELYEQGVQDEQERWRQACYDAATQVEDYHEEKIGSSSILDDMIGVRRTEAISLALKYLVEQVDNGEAPLFSEEEMKKTKLNVNEYGVAYGTEKDVTKLAESDRQEIYAAVSDIELAVMQNAAELCGSSLKEWVIETLVDGAYTIVDSQKDQEYMPADEWEAYVPPLETETVITPQTLLEKRVHSLEEQIDQLEGRVYSLEVGEKGSRLREHTRCDVLKQLISALSVYMKEETKQVMLDRLAFSTPKIDY